MKRLLPPLLPGERVRLAPGLEVCRLISGCRQLSQGHSGEPLQSGRILELWESLIDIGGTTFDVADIYRGVEPLLGTLVRQLDGHDEGDRPQLQILTKCTPDLDALTKISRRYIEGLVDRSLSRLGVERLDLVQFQWWDFSVPGYLAAAGWLDELRRAGKIRHLGVADFDEPHLRQVLEADIPVVSNQVQYSLLDRRAESSMVGLCHEYGIGLLAYGTLGGGFISAGYLGAEQPPAAFANQSLTRYRLIIEEFGGWALFQDLLQALDEIATRHGVSLATVAARWVLERDGVAALVLGLRSGNVLRLHREVFSFSLDEEDYRRIDNVLDLSPGLAGDVSGLERQWGGPHAAVREYNLNRGPGE